MPGMEEAPDVAAAYARGFADGYDAGLLKGLSTTGALLAALSFLCAIGLRAVYVRLRAVVRPLALQQVFAGERTVIALQVL